MGSDKEDLRDHARVRLQDLWDDGAYKAVEAVRAYIEYLERELLAAEGSELEAVNAKMDELSHWVEYKAEHWNDGFVRFELVQEWAEEQKGKELGNG